MNYSEGLFSSMLKLCPLCISCCLPPSVGKRTIWVAAPNVLSFPGVRPLVPGNEPAAQIWTLVCICYSFILQTQSSVYTRSSRNVDKSLLTIHLPEMKTSSVQNACEKDTHFYQPGIVPHSSMFTESDLSIYVWFSDKQGVRSVLARCEKWERYGHAVLRGLSQVEQLLKSLFLDSVLEVWSLFCM